MGKRTLAALLAFAVTPVSAQQDARNTVYRGGYWFDGAQFVQRDVHVRNGIFQDNGAPAGANIVDISGKFVAPPFCEAHNHDLGAGKGQERNSRYMNAGVFYVAILNNEPTGAKAERPFWRRQTSVDVVFANGGFTGRGGHPVEVLEGIKKGGGYPANVQLADGAYFEVDTAQDVDKKWPLLLASNPDLVKVFLQSSDQYDLRKDDPAYFGNRGVSPAALRRVVTLARKSGKRVFAHVTTAADFHHAIQAGVDVVAHLPGYMSLEAIAPSDAALAAERGIALITTTSLAKSYPIKNVTREALRARQIDNLRILRDANVTLAVGSDTWGDTSHLEVAHLRSLGVFTDLQILKMWMENCPKVVFPKRKIGKLAPGYEANFLVLDGNPLTDFKATRGVAMRVKNGIQLEAPPGPSTAR